MTDSRLLVVINDNVRVQALERIAVLTINNPPVNALSGPVISGMLGGIEAAIDACEIDAIVLVCAGRTFIAGADVKSLDARQAKADFFELQRRMDNSSKPLIAAMHGTPLGGGFELALTCHYRIAVRSARCGLPEVKLGLLPGGGGTQRLPRLTGIEPALEMLTSGRHIPAPEALRIGLIDAIVEDDDLQGSAIAFARRVCAAAPQMRRVRDLTVPGDMNQPQADIIRRFRKDNAQQLRNLKAAEAIIQCVEAAVALPFDEGLSVERAMFDRVLASKQSAALRHVFTAERRAAHVPDIAPDIPAVSILTVGVVVAGMTGREIARVFLEADLAVRLIDRNEQELSIVRDCDLIIEAVGESMPVKTALLSELDRTARPGTIFASTTSWLDLEQIAAATQRPESVIGLHFFPRADVTKLIEVVRGHATAPHVVAVAMKLARRVGKIAVLSANCPGFIANRMLAALQLQCDRLVLEGVEPGELNRVLEDFGFPTAAFATRDPARPPVARAVATTVAAGEATAPRPADGAEILERLLYPVINEGARMLADGIALRASDIDAVWVSGFGFPAYRGGPMYFAEQVGLARIVEKLRRDGIEPTPYLAARAAACRGWDAPP